MQPYQLKAPAARKGSLRVPQYAGGDTGSRRLPGSAWRPGPAAQDSLGKPSALGLPVWRATGQASRWTQRGRPANTAWRLTQQDVGAR